ncbi:MULTISPECIES: 4-oxalocrotonate tautomerase family protein [unclassified Variovorax]|uniref:tautomerase family protein n=1 Tax=unclassified Variovorax TaxID=663243 RepID=UPI0025779161|nr:MULTISPECIES: 4-oxalocrotonate tautomerase family protein [unclassified Variovorax]MDM0086338.1 4-oxalocrotonate tautomerase family protein [Variovorax sp. J22G40]MDM0145405.1 4-oxalocrotonate tautomerase family protein [Variovorax sp. J2P1-31]
MPGIHLTLSGQPDAELTPQLAEQLTQLTCRVLKKERSRTRVIVQYVPADQWFVAGAALADDGRRSFELQVTITEQTNTRSEKADYHKAAYELLGGLLGTVHPHSSIHVLDCQATSYGYGGVTQEWRYQHG